MRNIYLVMGFLLATSGSQAQQSPFQKKLPLIDQYIDSLLREWNIPGLALGIVHGDQLIYGKGYGYRDLEKKLPVETSTLFPIASNTKLFTATAACLLAEEGKLSLDKPARTYLPALHFSSDELDAKVTLRDMLSHRTGLPSYDALWLASPLSRREGIDRVTYMKPSLGFREGFLYNNMMYVGAGAVLEAVTGTTWEELIRKRLFEPLHMKASVFTRDDLLRATNYSLSYFEPDTTRQLLPRRYIVESEALGPAGTIKSTIEDMSHWMIAQLNGGRYQGVQVIPENALKQTLVPNVIADKEGKWEELSHSLYGLGRFMHSYKGHKLTFHTGSLDGYYSNLTFLPKQKLGIFVVYNGEPGGSFRSALTLPIIDRLLGLSYTPWSQRYRKEYLEFMAKMKRAKEAINATQVKNTVPSHPLAAYGGTFTHPVYGDILIQPENNALVFSFRRVSAPLHHFHYDQFITREEGKGMPDFRLHFLTNDQGEIDRISMQPFGAPAAEFVRNKKP